MLDYQVVVAVYEYSRVEYEPNIVQVCRAGKRVKATCVLIN